MDALLHDWPYLGLPMAVAMLGWLLLAPRPADAPPRLQDPVWLLRLLFPMYLVHQFEEHGIDCLGHHYAFLGSLCTTLGHSDLATCPGDPLFIFAVNVVACWFVFALPFAVGRTRPLLAACAWGVPVVNGLTHVVAGIAHRAYNPGLATSLLLFLPLCVLALRAAVRSGAIALRQLPRVVLSGVLIHVVLIASLLLREHGLPYVLFIAINALNGLTPVAVATLGAAPPQPAPAT